MNEKHPMKIPHSVTTNKTANKISLHLKQIKCSLLHFQFKVIEENNEENMKMSYLRKNWIGLRERIPRTRLKLHLSS